MIRLDFVYSVDFMYCRCLTIVSLCRGTSACHFTQRAESQPTDLNVVTVL